LRAKEEDGVNYVKEGRLFIKKNYEKPREVHTRQVLSGGTLP